MNRRHLVKTGLLLLASTTLTCCITEDFPECPNDYGLKIVFERNMLRADAFASQVKSVDIKVFDHTTGQEVYSYSEEGEALTSGEYRVALPVPPGSYDILCWGGMADGTSFSLARPTAETLDANSVILNTEDGVSAGQLNNLFHGLDTGVTFTDNNDTGSTAPQTATISLTKDTNRVNVILYNLDGTGMTEDDFKLTISSVNGELSYDNSLSAQRSVLYKPWAINTVTPETDGLQPHPALSAEFSLSRLCDSSVSSLDVTRTSDGKRIISIPLERNLLLYKGQFHASMSNQEYLDRQDDYTITFILDKDNNWNRSALIYINGWATPPVQYQEW